MNSIKYKSYFLLICLFISPIQKIHGLDYKKAAAVIAGISTGTAISLAILAYKERTARNNVQQDLDGRNLIAEAGSHIKQVEGDYSRFLALFKDKEALLQEEVKTYLDFLQPYNS